jgi:hypothetical protein
MTTVIVSVPRSAVHQASLALVSVAGWPPMVVFAFGLCQFGEPS